MNRDLARTEASALYSAARGEKWLNVFWENDSRNGAKGSGNASEAAIIPWDQSPKSAAAQPDVPPVDVPPRHVARPVGGRFVPARQVAEPVLLVLAVPQKSETVALQVHKSPAHHPRGRSELAAAG